MDAASLLCSDAASLLCSALEEIEGAPLEEIDGTTLAPHAARLSLLVVQLAKRSSQRLADTRPSLEALPNVLIARALSFLAANQLARVARLSVSFRSIHVPAAMAVRVAQLQLNTAYDYQRPLDLLLAETEAEGAARAADKLWPTGYSGIDGVCLASAKASASPPAAINGEYIFSLSLVNLLYPPREDGFGVPDYATDAAYKHVFYTHSDVKPTFPLTEDASAVLRDPRAGMARCVREARPMLEEAGSAAVVCAYVSVTRASTGKTAGLLQVERFGDEDAEDIEVTHLMPKHHISEHDERTHGGYMAGIFKYFLRLDAEGIDLFEGPLGNDEDDDEGAVGEQGAVGEEVAVGEGGAVQTAGVGTTAKMSLAMWSEVHSAGSWGGECSGHKEYGIGDLNDTLLCLLRGILFDN